jgi:hypothetical protein
MNADLGKKWDYENGFYLAADVGRLTKALAQWELFKAIPRGDVVEVGVFKGSSLMRLAEYRRAKDDNEYRAIVGFDTFGYFPTDEVHSSHDKSFIKEFIRQAGSPSDKEEIAFYIENKGFSNITLIEGNIFNTLPLYCHQKPEIALINLDVDAYEPTKEALTYLLPSLVKGGVILLDDYAHCEGAKQACDEVLGKENIEAIAFYPNMRYYIKNHHGNHFDRNTRNY